MKKVIDVSIGGISFAMEDDAYFRLKEYLKRFEETIPNKQEAREVMEDVEARVAEIFLKEMKFPNQVVDEYLVQTAIDYLGEVEPITKNDVYDNYSSYTCKDDQGGYTKGEKRFYRDPDNKMIAGICSGLAIYLGVDVTIIRIILVIAFFVYGTGLLAYLIVWLVTPKAETVAQKLELRGYAPTAENICRFMLQNK